MKQQYKKILKGTEKLLDQVDELMSMNINHPQERLLYQVKYKLMESEMFMKASEIANKSEVLSDPDQKAFDFTAPIVVDSVVCEKITPLEVNEFIDTIPKKVDSEISKHESLITNINPAMYNSIKEVLNESTEKGKTQFTLSVDSEPYIEVIQQHNTVQEALEAQPAIVSTEPVVEKIFLSANPNIIGMVVADEPKLVDDEPVAEVINVPSVDDMRMAFVSYCKLNGNDKGRELLTLFNAKNISEIYAQGDLVVSQFYSKLI